MEQIITENDVYVLSVTKKYLVINNNYEGLIVFDKQFNFIKKIYVNDELLIYHSYSSVMNDYIIIHDTDNEILYSINVSTETIASTACEHIFNLYYYVNNDMFYLVEKAKIFEFDYLDLQIINTHKNDFKDTTLLSNFQQKSLALDNSKKLIYDNAKIVSPPEDINNYVMNSNTIIGYTEDNIYIYINNIWKHLYRSEEIMSIRSCDLDQDSLFILLNSKTDVLVSNVIKQAILK